MSDISVGSVVQIHPVLDGNYGGCFVLVSRILPRGMFEGYIFADHYCGQAPQTPQRFCNQRVRCVGQAAFDDKRMPTRVDEE